MFVNVEETEKECSQRRYGRMESATNREAGLCVCVNKKDRERKCDLMKTNAHFSCPAMTFYTHRKNNWNSPDQATKQIQRTKYATKKNTKLKPKSESVAS